MSAYVPVVMGVVCTLLGTLILMLWNGLKGEVKEIKHRVAKLEERKYGIAVLEEKINRCESDLKETEQRIRSMEMKAFPRDC